MHDPASPETESKDDGSKAGLESKRRKTEDYTSSKPSSGTAPCSPSHPSGQSAAAETKGEGMGSQTQQTMNGGNDVVMANSEENSGGDDRQSAAAKANGEGSAEANGNGTGNGNATPENRGEEKKADGTNGIKPSETQEGAAKAPAAAAPPPPVLRGTLSYNVDLRRHLIRGMWNYENSNAFPAQRFELLRNLDPGEDPTELPKDGEFHGSFSLAYFHTTSKGKQKERSKVIPESGVNIKFTKIEGQDGSFKVDGKGTNQFGIFHINGTATLTPHDDGQYEIVLRKRYEPSAPAPAAAVESDPAKKSKKRKMGSIAGGGDGANDKEEGPLPPPSKSYESNVVCMRGKLYKEESEELGGVGDIVHRINGMWSSGLDLILADPQNVRGLCNRFEYEHKSSVPSNAFPVSGRYSGWFFLNVDDGTKKKITEKDVTLRFRKNNAGYHNVEGKGSNAFGKYSITGTLTMDNVITIFRHFQQKKVKAPRPVTSAPPPINAPGQSRRPSLPSIPDPQLKFDEVKVPENEDNLEPLKHPEHSTYSAVSRGVLRLNDDGSHSCQGKWAVTREHFNNGQTSNFTFRLEAHFAADAMKKSSEDGRQFPLDSEMFKGSFQLKKGGTRYQTIIDEQIVMKFRKNTAGSYNVYGKGVNSIGVFNLSGTLIMSGKTSGHVEVYRMYPPEMLAPVPTKSTSTSGASIGKALVTGMPDSELPPVSSSIGPSSSTMLPGPPRAGTGARRESTRLVKVPSRLEDDDPDAQLARIMEKCNLVLRFIREKDVERGAFFSEPVDPVALGIPTYHQVISEPMDLRTLHRKMEAGEVTSPEEFARLVRLVFENAMTFNVDPTHSVHQAARNLLILFNQKYRDIERMVTTLRRGQKGAEKKNDKKRKRGEQKSLKRQRLDEAQEMAAANANALSAIVSAAPVPGDGAVTRNEFNLMLHMIQQLQQQVVQTYTVLADTLSDEIDDSITTAHDLTSSLAVPSADILPPVVATEKKKPAKKKEPAKVVEKPVEEDSRPLTLQEQELLTETINELPADHLHGVIQIIRDAAGLTGEEDEIDLEIDQLDAVTQRKLLRHVSKFIKKPKQKAKATKKPRPAPASAPAPKKVEKAPASEKKATKATTGKKENPNSIFAFGKGDSDSDSDGEITSPGPAPVSEANDGGVTSAPAAATASKDQGFHFGGNDSDDDDNDEDMGDAAPAASWSIAKPAMESQNNDGDDDDEWGAARKEAAAAEARAEDRKKREEKVKAEAEQAKSQRLADAVNRGEEIKAQRQAEEEVEAREREKQEKEAEEQRRAAREAARAQVQAVQQTVDLDAQRDIMQEYEQSFLEKEMGSASPSSDFGF